MRPSILRYSLAFHKVGRYLGWFFLWNNIWIQIDIYHSDCHYLCIALFESMTLTAVRGAMRVLFSESCKPSSRMGVKGDSG